MAHNPHLFFPDPWDEKGIRLNPEQQGLLVVTDLTGSGTVPPGASRYTVLVGPEGGFNEDEMPLDAVRIRLANRVLRTETAAIVGTSAVLKELQR